MGEGEGLENTGSSPREGTANLGWQIDLVPQKILPQISERVWGQLLIFPSLTPLGLCSAHPVAAFSAQSSGHSLDASSGMIIEPSPGSTLYKECSPIIPDWLIKS